MEHPVATERHEKKWAHLTRIPMKARLYDRESYFRDGWIDVVEVWDEKAAELLKKVALLVIKPDGLVSGKASTVLSFLKENDFSVTAVEALTFSRFHWRELWRYQLTCATVDRLAVNDLVLRNEALLLLLWDEQDSDIPAAVRLSGLKGPSDISAQPANCLRRQLAQPNRVISYIHVADEPADVVRELAVFLDASARRRVLATAGGMLSAGDKALLEEKVAHFSRVARRLDPADALRRLQAVLCQGGYLQKSPAAPLIKTAVDRMTRGERIVWRPFVKALADAAVEVDPWDLATLGSSFIVYDEPGTEKVIQAVDSNLWRASER